MKLKNIFLLLLALVVLSSCEDFLHKTPVDQLGEDDFYRNAEELDKAVLGCYSSLRLMANEEWYLTELRSDNSRLWQKNSTATDSRNMMAMDNFIVETTHPYVQSYWENSYKSIYLCNAVLDNIGNAEDEAMRKQLEGEARFMRAHVYFNLVRLYGPVFLVTEPLSVDAYNEMARSSIDDVYATIIADLEFGAENLPISYDESQLGRVTSWAAKTMLAKAYLTQPVPNYTEAKSLLLEVTSEESGFGLEDDYSQIFSTDNEINTEVIFAIRYLSGGVGQGSPFANHFAPANSVGLVAGRTRGFNCPTDDLLSAYEVGDDVRKYTTLQDHWVKGSGESAEDIYVSWVNKLYYPTTIDEDGENDFIVLRYADVLLMLAEIENELSGASAALPYINEVRFRAGIDILTDVDVPGVREMRLALEQERRVEFAFENHRYFDLLRTGRLSVVMEYHYNTETIRNSGTGDLDAYYTNEANESYLPENFRKIEEWKYLLPIPFSVISAAPNATQNPGY